MEKQWKSNEDLMHQQVNISAQNFFKFFFFLELLVFGVIQKKTQLEASEKQLICCQDTLEEKKKRERKLEELLEADLLKHHPDLLKELVQQELDAIGDHFTNETNECLSHMHTCSDGNQTKIDTYLALYLKLSQQHASC
ncbi:hypothetical protein RFI_12437 [Reticulomyxa filosa]|uniref:Uncharacterized protein n=1 Tax=Reticulomyxa filosa TaxID=46433 RepID=X6NFG3_RETFI|nr:hypothetical protein RFI_12437 [Reticulomyxa filosa]|eukprot:ETO24721.1 hypothetical protein RFI_12437 [Reticulomyxa filosa]